MISHKGLYLNSIFTINSVQIKPQNDKSSLISVLNHQISIIDRALPASACPFYGLACVACGGNKCHWCNVAIVARLNRYRGISQKRSVKSSCIGWLSCMLGKPSQRYRHTSTGSAWEKVQDLQSLSAQSAKLCADTTDIRGSEAKRICGKSAILKGCVIFLNDRLQGKYCRNSLNRSPKPKHEVRRFGGVLRS